SEQGKLIRVNTSSDGTRTLVANHCMSAAGDMRIAGEGGELCGFPHWDHFRAEEDEVLPLAQNYLTAQDWDIVDAAFSGHTNPLLGVTASAEYDKLFRRIVSLAPPPLGTCPG